MFADAIAKITESIFPIFFAYEQDGVPTLGVSGTGFFVEEDGLFVSVDHIMNCAPAGSTYYFYGKLPDQVCQPAVEIERIARDPKQDLFLGRVTRDYLSPVEFSSEKLRPGDDVCLSGYPMAVLSVNAQGGFVGNVRRYWQPTYVVDVTQAMVEGRTFDGYLVGHAAFSGMSGGPVFDTAGEVRGMAVATMTRTIPSLEGDPTLVTNGIVLDVEHIRAFMEAHRPALATAGR
jgi:S1-C subfamily serine protease